MQVASSHRGHVSVVCPPAATPVSLGDVKTHLRIDHDDEDDLLLDAIGAATGEIDSPNGWLGRSLMQRMLMLSIDGHPPSVICLPGPPVDRVMSIVAKQAEEPGWRDVYNLDNGVDLIDLQHELLPNRARIWPGKGCWLANHGLGSLHVSYYAGYEDTDKVPKPIKQWLLMRVGELYRDREASVLGVATNRLPHVDRMLDNWRIRD